MSQIFISAMIIAIINLGKFLGVEIGSEAATTVASTIVTIALAGWIAYRRKSVGDINAAGMRK